MDFKPALDFMESASDQELKEAVVRCLAARADNEVFTKTQPSEHSQQHLFNLCNIAKAFETTASVLIKDKVSTVRTIGIKDRTF